MSTVRPTIRDSTGRGYVPMTPQEPTSISTSRHPCFHACWSTKLGRSVTDSHIGTSRQWSHSRFNDYTESDLIFTIRPDRFTLECSCCFCKVRRRLFLFFFSCAFGLHHAKRSHCDISSLEHMYAQAPLLHHLCCHTVVKKS